MIATLPSSASLVRIELRVRDVESLISYYRDLLGLEVVGTAGSVTTLAPEGRRFFLDLVHEPDAPLRPYPCPGLYHFALVVPDRPALGAVFRHLVETRQPFEGMADHLVSEALYIRDPENNGIELYRDRPREDWPKAPDGSLRMASDPLDVDGVIDSAAGASTLHPETRFGHIHLHVRDLKAAEDFFASELGLERTTAIPGALFFAVGGYHHHVGANTWAPDREAPAEATGLISYTFSAPGRQGSSELTDPTGATVYVASDQP